MERLKRWGGILFFLIFISGQVFAQIDTVKFNRYYFKKYWTDSKAIATSPFHWKSKDWTRLGVFVVAESGLTLADPAVRDFFQSNHNKTATFVSTHILQGFGAEHSLLVMGGIFTYGVLAKNDKSVSTALLALESFALASLVTRVPKTLIGRERPHSGDGPYQFNGPFTNVSFPSGHTTASFAVASVIATQFRDSKWIPVTAYSVATLAGLSRIYDDEHWLTDVVAGAAIGTLVGNLVSHRTSNSRLTFVPFGGSNFQGIKVVYALN